MNWWLDKKAEEELELEQQPVPGVCPTCQADTTEDPHEGWCPNA